ncbi:Hypothetical predicted protein [Marmota monax]|uniref:Dynein heavy chain tail domain-containing protein n=1 Tax=Marmota monax TaxID=9995 RepID=A0A5E4C0U2_MARMO|nr:Hypothetical predicted protein [Marmota monax]
MAQQLAFGLRQVPKRQSPTRTFLSPEEVLKGLQGEIEEVLSGISLSVHVLKQVFQAYDFCCTNMKLFFKDLYKTAIEFLKLEKIELGGVRGNILGSRVTQIYDEVFELVKVFAECKYDPLDPGDSSFDNDYADFETKIQDLDRRLATIFCQAFDDCSSIESSAKLLYMCGSLLERPLILAEVVPRYSTMLEMFDTELDNAKLLYDAQMAASAEGNIPPIHKNMPSVAGQLKWSLGLQERLEVSMKHLKHIDHPVMSSMETKMIYQKYDEMLELLHSYREKVYKQWVDKVDEDCHFNLGQPLIQRHATTGLLQVNFSKALVAVLREVKYLNFQQQKEIPGSAEHLFSENETFRKFVGNLELIVGWYNQLVAVLREVKYLNFQQQKEIPGSAEHLFSENETFRKFVGNLELIVGWYNQVGCDLVCFSGQVSALVENKQGDGGDRKQLVTDAGLRQACAVHVRGFPLLNISWIT